MSALSFVPTKGNFEKRTIGGAQVTVVDGGKVKITYLPKIDSKTKQEVAVSFPDGASTKIFESSKLPIQFEPGFDEILVVTATEGGEISFSPYSASFKCRFDGFWRPNGEGTPPTWKESEPKTWNNGKGQNKSYTTLDFRAYFVIDSNPIFKGVKLPVFLRYLFVKNEANGMTGVNFELISATRAKQSKNGQFLLDVLNSCGALDEPIAWPEDGNVLPELEARMKKANKLVRLTLKDGWVVGVEGISRIGDDFEAAPAEVVKTSNPDEM